MNKQEECNNFLCDSFVRGKGVLNCRMNDADYVRKGCIQRVQKCVIRKLFNRTCKNVLSGNLKYVQNIFSGGLKSSGYPYEREIRAVKERFLHYQITKREAQI